MLLATSDNIDVAHFLSEYWQQQPLLIKGAMPGFSDFLSPEELAGLACEDDVESRLVSRVAGDWHMKTGPLTERDFKFLPEQDWTLLVQSVDHWLPEVQSLLQWVPFLPGWRLDDVMVSYAAKDGGVGPHFDYYDVFLVQGMGSRRWQVGAKCDSTSPIDTSSGLKILEDFTPTQEWILETGDVLYIPAGLSHCGTALTAGLSYSIGFRAPDIPELLAATCDHAADFFSPDTRYTDPPLVIDARPGEIDSRAMKRVGALLQEAVADEELLLQSFGRLMTEPRLPELLEPPDTTLTAANMAVMLQKGMFLARHPATRMACHHDQKRLYLFVNGECLVFDNPHPLLDGLNNELQQAIGRELDLKKFQRNEACLELISSLFNQGYLVRKTAHD